MPRLGILLAVALLAAGCQATPTEVDGCRSVTDCEIGELCLKPAGSCDGLGQCAVRPQMCAQLHQPVCACDGVTYSNACVANAAGESVAAPGPCEGRL